MFEIDTLKKILEEYKSIFSDILYGFEFEGIEDNQIIFSSFSKNKMTANINGDIINFYYQNNNIERQIKLEIPNKDEDTKVNETIKEIRQNGIIIENIERVYAFSQFSDENKTLVDLLSKRYVFDKNIEISNIDKYLDNLCLMKTIFESHMHILIRTINSLRWHKDSQYSTHTLLNGKDISHIYDIVDGIDKISRIYDLYNGIINERNKDDIFKIHLGLLKKECLGYKEVIGITDKENSICDRKEVKKQLIKNLQMRYPKNLLKKT